jgi:hypothetical protein
VLVDVVWGYIADLVDAAGHVGEVAEPLFVLCTKAELAAMQESALPFFVSSSSTPGALSRVADRGFFPWVLKYAESILDGLLADVESVGCGVEYPRLNFLVDVRRGQVAEAVLFFF